MRVMLSLMLEGIWLGLASGALCVGCWFVLVPVMASAGKGRAKPAVWTFAQFTLGRLVTYIAFGAVAGYVGSQVSGAGWVTTAAAVAYIPLSALLLLQGLRGKGSRLCQLAEKAGAKSRFPFWIGLLMGASICPPFLIATVRVVREGSTVGGMASFGGYFAGTTVVLLPSVFLGLAGRAQFVRRLGRAACLLAALFFLYQGLAGLVEIPQTTVVEVTQADLESLIPEAESFSERIEPAQGPPYREAFDTNGEQLALVYSSSDICPGIRGFGGHVPLLVAVQPQERKVLSVGLLPGWETPSYVTRIYDDKYLGAFRNKPVGDPFTPGKDIDAITGATVTNKAICEEVRAVLGVTVGREGAQEGGFPVPVSAFALFAAFALASFSYVRRVRWLRPAIMVGSIVYFGFYMKGLMLSSADVVKVMFFGGSVLEAGVTWLVLAGGIVVTSLLFGRLFCGYICPFGALHELCGRATRGRIDLSGKAAGKLKYLKYVVLFAAPALFLATGRVSNAALEPFGTLFSFSGSGSQWLYALFVLGAGFVVMRFFCRFLCPAGALMAILSLPRIIRDQRRTDCSACGKCIKACPVDALSQAESILDADYTECIDCNKCTRAQQTAPCSKASAPSEKENE